MTRRNRIERLRVVPPTLDPDPVLLGRLAALSAASEPAPHTVRTTVTRLVAVAATVAAIGGTTWAAGALPGIDSPVGPAGRPSQGLTVPSIDASVTPQTDASTASGSPSSPGLPDATDSLVTPPFGDDPPGASGAHRRDGEHGHRGTGRAHGHDKDKGHAHGQPGNGKGPGHHIGRGQGHPGPEGDRSGAGREGRHTHRKSR